MIEPGPHEGYRRVYKKKGYVDSDGNEYRKFKDKRVATIGSVATVFGIAILASVLPQAGVNIMMGTLVCIALVMWTLRLLIGADGVLALAEKAGYVIGHVWSRVKSG